MLWFWKGQRTEGDVTGCGNGEYGLPVAVAVEEDDGAVAAQASGP